jgi:hypothetical protein
MHIRSLPVSPDVNNDSSSSQKVSFFLYCIPPTHKLLAAKREMVHLLYCFSWTLPAESQNKTLSVALRLAPISAATKV